MHQNASVFLRQIGRPELSRFGNALLIFHDQLNLDQFPDRVLNKDTVLVFVESAAKGLSLPYHKKKLVYVLSSQRHFALECREKGYAVAYLSGQGHYDQILIKFLVQYPNLHFQYMEPAEWDSRARLAAVGRSVSNEVSVFENSFFMFDPAEYAERVKNGFLLEYFYRDVRKKTGFLIQGDGSPEGGQWNFDKQNRKKLPRNITIPEIKKYAADSITNEVMQLVDERFGDNWGDTEGFSYPVSREQAWDQFEDFISQRLSKFGDYEDAMALDEPYIFHSLLALNLNNGLLTAWEVCERIIRAYEEGQAPLNAVEGIIRQIIGWREYVRIYYEALMPEIRSTNALHFEAGLPEMYWTAQTDLSCMSQILGSVKEDAYTHHIPRLMVLSNFSNLTATDPGELWLWFWYGFVDAYEWVVLPNVLGMSTFADGGILASKPYVAGANYINKMSNYCGSCRYNPKKRTGQDACPFNYLYWNFVDVHRELFTSNGRVSFMVNMFDKMADSEKELIRNQAAQFIAKIPRREQVKMTTVSGLLPAID